MQKIILILMMSFGFLLADCSYYLNEAKKYEYFAKQQPNPYVARDYFNISGRFFNQYKQCIAYQKQQRYYQGYRSNPYQQKR